MLPSPGEPAPWFTAPTPGQPEFAFDTAAGRFVLMAFLPAVDPATVGPALTRLAQAMPMFDEARLCAIVVVRDPLTAQTARDMRGLRWVLDLDGRVSRLYGALDAEGVESPGWLLLDPGLRVISASPLSQAEDLFRNLANLPAPGDHAGVPIHAPVLLAPRVFDENLCARLIALHEVDGGRFTGVMRDEGDRTFAVMDPLKRRRDVLVGDPDLRAEIQERLERALFPAIAMALGFAVTRVERYVVSCYDAADHGVFRPHRDSTTFATAHRRFACSINLNDDFEGGDLRFGEFGPTTYRPPPGGAVVFSCALLHEAMPVTRGRRYAFLPFFYDEAGADVLDAYERRVGLRPEPAV
jgi:predicted 2-oxoglutarate/Fe(II)-dependent dioxygenase YbiX/peroxiredoxin